MACNVVELATVNFLEKEGYIRWHEVDGYPGEYRIPKNKVEKTRKAIKELTIAARKYGVTNPSQMFHIVEKPYNLTPGTSERVDNMISKGITSYYVLEEDIPFVTEFQEKFDRFQEERKVVQSKIDFDAPLKDKIKTMFSNNPEFFDIGSQEDYLEYLEVTNKGDVVNENDFEDFQKFVENRNREIQSEEDFRRYTMNAPGSYTNTRTGETVDTTNLAANSAYVNSKRQLLENLKTHLEDYYKLNKGKEHTELYKKRIKELNEVINEVSDELSLLTATDAKTIFRSVINEIEILSEILDNPDTFNAENFELIQRLNILSNLILGQNIDGTSIIGDRIMFNGEGIEGFNDYVVEPMTKLKLKYDDYLYNVAENAFLNNPIFIENRDKFTDEQIQEMLKSVREKGNDINFFQAYFLGVNSNADSILFKIVNDLLQTNVRKVEQSIGKKEKALSEVQERLRKKKFDIDKFYAKDENGIKTGRLISKYTAKWFRSLNVLHNLKKEFDSVHNQLKPQKYKEIISWYDENVSFIDIRKLKVFKDRYSEGYGKYFKFSDEEMTQYEKWLREELGKGYDEAIETQMENIERFISYSLSESDKNTIWTQKNISAASPFKFLENYDSKNKRNAIPTVVGSQTTSVFNIGKYNHFIPKRYIVDKTTEDLIDNEYYDKIFEKDIESDPDAYEAQRLLQDLLSNHINPAYSLNGNVISSLQIPMLRKEFSETWAESKRKGILSLIKAMVHNVINNWKDIWFDQTYSSDRKGVVANYSNAALREINNYKRVLQLKSLEDLLKKADELGLHFKSNETKDRIIDGIARAEVLPEFSNDIFQNVLTVSSYATLHRARQDTSFIAELLYKVHIKPNLDGKVRELSNKKFRAWIDTNVYGKRNEKSQENNVITKANLKRLSDADKRLKKVLQEINVDNLGEDVVFYLEGIRYTSRLSDDKNREFVAIKENESGENFEYKTISSEEFEEKLNTYIKNQVDSLGISMTFSSLVSGILNNLSIKFLGFNPKSGLKNRIEGAVMNSIIDAEGTKWTRGNNRNSTRILSLANIFRLSNGKLDNIARKKALQLKTINQLVQRLGVLQDRKDFRDKKNQVSAYDKYKDFLDVYNFAIGMPEYRNQVEIVLNILQDQKITNYKGETVSFVNGTGIVKDSEGRVIETGQYMSAYIPGTLTLKDEYKYTAEAFNEDGTLKDNINLNDYINMDNIGYETFQVFDAIGGKTEGSNAIHLINEKIQDTINKTQGNFSSMDSILVMRSTLGRFAMFFKRYLPELVNQRFGTFGNDIIQGKYKSEGRYRVLFRNPGALGVLASTVATVFFGPLIGGGFLATAFLPYLFHSVSNRWFNREINVSLADNLEESVGMLKEILIRTMDFPLGIVHSKWRFRDIKSLGDNQFFEKLKDKEVLTEDEAGALIACAEEIAITIGSMLFIMLAKNALGGGDDEDEDKKQLRNFIDNYGNQIMENLTQFYDPVGFVKNNFSRLVLFSTLEDTEKFLTAFRKYIDYDEGTLREVTMKGLKAQPLVPIINFVAKPIEVGDISGIWKDEKEYDSGQWFDKVVKSKEAISKEKLTNRRESLKKKYIDLLSDRYREELGFSKSKADVVAEETARKMMNNPEISRQYREGETFEDALERIDFKEATKLAEEAVAEVELEEPEEEEEATE